MQKGKEGVIEKGMEIELVWLILPNIFEIITK